MEVSYLPDLLSIAPPPFIYIHDPLSLLPFHPADKLLGKLTIQIDCNECITSRILFTRIVNGLAKWCPTWADGCESWGGSDGYGAWDASWDSFVHALRGVVLKDDIKGKGKAKADDDGRGEPFILLFKNAEKFSEVLPALFAPLTRLAELTNLNASVIFVSHYTWMDLRPGWGASPEPLVIAVPPLNTDQITAYLISLFPLSRSPSEITPYNPTLHSIYKGYVRILYDACSSATQDPRQLAYIAAARWPGFIAPLLQDWKHIDSERMDDEEDIEYPLPSENDQLRLVVLFKSTFTIALDALQPRLSHARAWANEHAPPETVRLSDPSTGAVLNTGKRAKSHGITPLLAVLLDLPIHTQIILVASYLASHNPAKTDIRMFGRASDGGKKKSKRKGGVRKTKPGVVAKLSQRLTGPAPFLLDRLVAIHGSLVAEHVADSDEPEIVQTETSRVGFLSSVTQLVGMRLLYRTTVGDKLEGSTMFKTNIDYTSAETLAKSISIDLNDLLWDAERL